MTLNPANVNITTVGNATLTAAQLLAGFITRTGPTGAFTETLDTTANILAALGNSPTPFVTRYVNASANTATFAVGDANTTIAFGAGLLGGTTVLTHQEVEILFTPTGNAQNPGLTVTLLTKHLLVA
jgi:hypothetical protein